MKLISFLRHGTPGFGVLKGNHIIDIEHSSSSPPPSLAAALADRDALFRWAERPPDYSIDEVSLLPPIPDSGRIICVGLNYKSHIAETGREPPRFPMLFPRYPDSLVAHGEPMVKPAVSECFDFEGELAFVVGRPGRHISASNALQHVAGYACFNDGSVRDWQRHTSQFLPGKNFTRSGSFGPWLVTPDEFGDVGTHEIETRLNGELMQSARLDDLLFGVAELVAYISTIWTIRAGDVVATGTTGGVGLYRDPQIWMKPGDTVEVSITGIGTLTNVIAAERSLESGDPGQ